ncbi:Hypothetical_protein [Hexamita inflata]|uniref:Hypothetical_protein n=1 Tax=Hexamita inflata TaxID=28002 RepID=A0AA86U294_9EUKA|nr:Hypothetical protein HINF_LOCUS23177 [Hexamita inflata]
MDTLKYNVENQIENQIKNESEKTIKNEQIIIKGIQNKNEKLMENEQMKQLENGTKNKKEQNNNWSGNKLFGSLNENQNEKHSKLQLKSKINEKHTLHTKKNEHEAAHQTHTLFEQTKIVSQNKIEIPKIPKIKEAEVITNKIPPKVSGTANNEKQFDQQQINQKPPVSAQPTMNTKNLEPACKKQAVREPPKLVLSKALKQNETIQLNSECTTNLSLGTEILDPTVLCDLTLGLEEADQKIKLIQKQLVGAEQGDTSSQNKTDWSGSNEDDIVSQEENTYVSKQQENITTQQLNEIQLMHKSKVVEQSTQQVQNKNHKTTRPPHLQLTNKPQKVDNPRAIPYANQVQTTNNEDSDEQYEGSSSAESCQEITTVKANAPLNKAKTSALPPNLVLQQNKQEDKIKVDQTIVGVEQTTNTSFEEEAAYQFKGSQNTQDTNQNQEALSLKPLLSKIGKLFQREPVEVPTQSTRSTNISEPAYKKQAVREPPKLVLSKALKQNETIQLNSECTTNLSLGTEILDPTVLCDLTLGLEEADQKIKLIQKQLVGAEQGDTSSQNKTDWSGSNEDDIVSQEENTYVSKQQENITTQQLNEIQLMHKSKVVEQSTQQVQNKNHKTTSAPFITHEQAIESRQSKSNTICKLSLNYQQRDSDEQYEGSSSAESCQEITTVKANAPLNKAKTSALPPNLVLQQNKQEDKIKVDQTIVGVEQTTNTSFEEEAAYQFKGSQNTQDTNQNQEALSLKPLLSKIGKLFQREPVEVPTQSTRSTNISEPAYKKQAVREPPKLVLSKALKQNETIQLNSECTTNLSLGTEILDPTVLCDLTLGLEEADQKIKLIQKQLVGAEQGDTSSQNKTDWSGSNEDDIVSQEENTYVSKQQENITTQQLNEIQLMHKSKVVEQSTQQVQNKNHKTTRPPHLQLTNKPQKVDNPRAIPYANQVQTTNNEDSDEQYEGSSSAESCQEITTVKANAPLNKAKTSALPPNLVLQQNKQEDKIKVDQTIVGVEQTTNTSFEEEAAYQFKGSQNTQDTNQNQEALSLKPLLSKIGKLFQREPVEVPTQSTRSTNISEPAYKKQAVREPPKLVLSKALKQNETIQLNSECTTNLSLGTEILDPTVLCDLTLGLEEADQKIKLIQKQLVGAEQGDTSSQNKTDWSGSNEDDIVSQEENTYVSKQQENITTQQLNEIQLMHKSKVVEQSTQQVQNKNHKTTRPPHLQLTNKPQKVDNPRAIPYANQVQTTNNEDSDEQYEGSSSAESCQEITTVKANAPLNKAKTSTLPPNLVLQQNKQEDKIKVDQTIVGVEQTTNTSFEEEAAYQFKGSQNTQDTNQNQEALSLKPLLSKIGKLFQREPVEVPTQSTRSTNISEPAYKKQAVREPPKLVLSKALKQNETIQLNSECTTNLSLGTEILDPTVLCDLTLSLTNLE